MASPERFPQQEDLFPHEPEKVPEEKYVPKGWKVGKSGKVENKQGWEFDDDVIEKAKAVVEREAKKTPHIMDGEKLPDDLVRFYAAVFQREKDELEEFNKAEKKKKK